MGKFTCSGWTRAWRRWIAWFNGRRKWRGFGKSAHETKNETAKDQQALRVRSITNCEFSFYFFFLATPRCAWQPSSGGGEVDWLWHTSGFRSGVVNELVDDAKDSLRFVLLAVEREGLGRRHQSTESRDGECCYTAIMRSNSAYLIFLRSRTSSYLCGSS